MQRIFPVTRLDIGVAAIRKSWVFIVFFVCFDFAFAGHCPEDAISDSTILTSAEQKSKLSPTIPSHRHGSIWLKSNDSSLLRSGKQQWREGNALSFTDELLSVLPSAYSLSLGAPGQFNHFSIFGGEPRTVSFLFNGRPINQRLYGDYNPELMPRDFIEEMEIFIGADAVVLADNASSLAVNFREVRFNSAKPFTKLRYAQAGYDYIGTEAVYAQNIESHWGVSAGFRRRSAPNRYSHSGSDTWNIYGSIRYAPTNSTTISLSNNFSNHGTLFNGGVSDNSQSISNDVIAEMRLSDSDERMYTHDITMTASIADDSLGVMQTASLYVVHENLEKNRGVFERSGVGDTLRLVQIPTRIVGATYRMEQRLLPFLHIRSGAAADYSGVASSVYNTSLYDWRTSAYAQAALTFSGNIELRGGLRLVQEGEQVFANFGGTLTARVSDFLFRGDIAFSKRAPAPIEGANLSDESISYIIGNVSGNFSTISLTGTAFFRNVESPIAASIVLDNGAPVFANFQNMDSRRALGASLSALWTGIPKLKAGIAASLQYSYLNDNREERFSPFTMRIFGEYRLNISASSVWFGASTMIVSAMTGEMFFEQMRVFHASPNSPLGGGFNGIDVYAGARLGNASVRVMMQNILSSTYWYVPIYPQLDQNIRLIVDWSFLE